MHRVGEIEYTHDHEIGPGQGRSHVYLADDPQTGGKVAIKEILKTGFRDYDEWWDEAKAMRAAENEYVVPILFGCKITDHVCIAMPYYRKGSLADRIRTGPLPTSDVIRIGSQILAGLTQIHAVPLVHFDVKPTNILFDDNDRAKVADLGQAQPIDLVGIAGAPELLYGRGIPPEAITLRRGTAASDIYQAGLTLYRAVNGDPHFKAKAPRDWLTLRSQTLDGTFPDRDDYLPHVPKLLRKVLRRAMSVETSERFGSCREFSVALGRVTYVHDWRMAYLPNDEIEWTSTRSPSPDLVVRLVSDSPKWGVTLHHARPGKETRTKTLLWKNSLTRTQAMKYLKQVFQSLE